MKITTENRIFGATEQKGFSQTMQDQLLAADPAHDAIHISLMMRKTTEADRQDSIDQHHDEP